MSAPGFGTRATSPLGMRHAKVANSLIVLALWGVFSACTGRDAPDEALCRDVIARLCRAPLCPGVSARLALMADCQGTLLARSGCDALSFSFQSLTRAAFLECRRPLLNNGDAIDDAPDCADVDAFLACTEASSMFSADGGAP